VIKDAHSIHDLNVLFEKGRGISPVNVLCPSSETAALDYFLTNPRSRGSQPKIEINDVSGNDKYLNAIAEEKTAVDNPPNDGEFNSLTVILDVSSSTRDELFEKTIFDLKFESCSKQEKNYEFDIVQNLDPNTDPDHHDSVITNLSTGVSLCTENHFTSNISNSESVVKQSTSDHWSPGKHSCPQLLSTGHESSGWHLGGRSLMSNILHFPYDHILSGSHSQISPVKDHTAEVLIGGQDSMAAVTDIPSVGSSPTNNSLVERTICSIGSYSSSLVHLPINIFSRCARHLESQRSPEGAELSDCGSLANKPNVKTDSLILSPMKFLLHPLEHLTWRNKESSPESEARSDISANKGMYIVHITKYGS